MSAYSHIRVCDVADTEIENIVTLSLISDFSQPIFLRVLKGGGAGLLNCNLAWYAYALCSSRALNIQPSSFCISCHINQQQNMELTFLYSEGATCRKGMCRILQLIVIPDCRGSGFNPITVKASKWTKFGADGEVSPRSGNRVV